MLLSLKLSQFIRLALFLALTGDASEKRGCKNQDKISSFRAEGEKNLLGINTLQNWKGEEVRGLW